MNRRSLRARVASRSVRHRLARNRIPTSPWPQINSRKEAKQYIERRVDSAGAFSKRILCCHSTVCPGQATRVKMIVAARATARTPQVLAAAAIFYLGRQRKDGGLQDNRRGPVIDFALRQAAVDFDATSLQFVQRRWPDVAARRVAGVESRVVEQSHDGGLVNLNGLA